MKKTFTVMTLVMALALSMVGTAMADGDGTYDFPSTNEKNQNSDNPLRPGQDAPHVNLVEATTDSVTLQFVNKASGGAFFEFRVDGEVPTDVTDHQVVIGDVSYPGIGVGFNPADQTERVETFDADEKVEVRLALGAERDWDFDWTTFEVLPFAGITSPDDDDVIEVHETLELRAEAPGATSVQWAVRTDTPDATGGTNNVAGNVTGVDDDFSFEDGMFSADLNISTWEPGTYFFVFNPSPGDRYVVSFSVAPDSRTKDACKDGGFDALGFRNQGQCVANFQANENASLPE